MVLTADIMTMVKALINIRLETNRVLNIIKAQHNLKDKSQAIDLMAKQYEERLLDPPLRPEFVKRAKRIMKQKKIHIGTMEDFDRMFNVKRT